MIFIRILFYLTIIFIVYNLSTKKYLNPYKLIMVFGKKGSGKTTFLTKVAIKNYRVGKTVYSTCRIPCAKIFNPNDIGRVKFEPDSIVLIDEVSLIWDNRNWKNMKPEVVEFFRYQRHHKLTIYMFSQSFDVDKKLRDLCDELYLLKNFARVFSICRKINKRITVSRPEDDDNGNAKNGCLVEDYCFAPIIMSGALQLTYIPRWVIFFDSFEVDEMPLIKYKEQLLTGEQYEAVTKKGYLKYLFVRFRIYLQSKIKKIVEKIGNPHIFRKR